MYPGSAFSNGLTATLQAQSPVQMAPQLSQAGVEQTAMGTP